MLKPSLSSRQPRQSQTQNHVQVRQPLPRLVKEHLHSQTTRFPRAYKNLSPKTRAGLGVGIIAWGGIGLYLSDRAEEQFGFSPTAKDKEDLERLTPRITVVDKPSPTNR
jgi:hypothetical protein